ncbi:MAG: hypothetical protein QME81_08455 [bacterium]|nr:hypothetical protein [bacterium]
MTADIINSIVTIAAFVLAAIIIIIAARMGRKAIKEPKGIKVEAGETRIGEMYGKTRDITLGGFTAAGSALEGKLILTNKRLVYGRYDEKGIVLSLEPKDVLSIEVGQKGLLIKSPTLKVTYTPKKGKQAEVITWTIPSETAVTGFLTTHRYKNPHTAESFATLLHQWKGDSIETLPSSKIDEATAESIQTKMREKSTQELLEIWNENNREEWRDEAFEAIRRVLTERGECVPEQSAGEY